MIRVGEDHTRTGLGHPADVHPFDRGRGGHRHEERSRHAPMRRRERARPRPPIGRLNREREAWLHQCWDPGLRARTPRGFGAGGDGLGGGERNAESELAVTCSEPADFVSTDSWAIARHKFHKIHRLLRVPPTSSAERIRDLPFACRRTRSLEGLPVPIETALETVRSQDGEGRFPSSERSTGCAQGASGEMARATPTHARRGLFGSTVPFERGFRRSPAPRASTARSGRRPPRSPCS